MRIIAGEFGGRKLLPPPTAATRPITDRAKQSLFDSLGDRIDGANVLDAFAGTGSMGLESLSRGAVRVVFIERDRGAVQNLRRNIAAFGVEQRSVVLPIDAYRAVRHHEVTGDGGAPIDLAFIDPPYAHTEPGREHARLERLLAELAADRLAPEGLISLRHPSQVSIASLVPQGFEIARELNFGSMRISWLVRENAG